MSKATSDHSTDHPKPSPESPAMEPVASETSTSVPGNLTRATRALVRGVPTIIILAVLAGLAWWGNQHGWRLPSFSQLSGKVSEEEVAWCDEHGVPEADCIACNADLFPKGELFGWCAEHGVHECVLHHPELAQLKEIPEVTAADFQRAERAIAVGVRVRNDSSCKVHLRRIQFPSRAAVDRAGIDIGLVDRGAIVESLQVTGELIYDPTQQTHISSRLPGTIADVRFQVGDSVRRGDVIAIIDATEVGQAKSKLLEERVSLDLARKRYERLRRIGDGVIPAREMEEAESAVATAEVAVANAIQRLSNFGLPTKSIQEPELSIDPLRNRLQFLGFPEQLVETLGDSSNLLPIYAPRDGQVVMRHAVEGEVIEAGRSLFTVVDNRRMWLMLNVPLEETHQIAIGQTVRFRPDGMSNESVGTIAWISTEVEAATRTVKVRGHLENVDGSLRNETFGSGEILLREESQAIVVPSEAIHWEGCCHVAFVRDKDYFDDDSFKVFHTRSVLPGVTIDGVTEVIAGLLPGEVIVTKGSGILRAELLKGNLGAG